MRKTKARAVGKAILYLVIALVIVGAIGIIFRFTNGFNEDFKTFYLKYNGEMIVASESKTFLRKGEDHRFDVIYTFDTDKSEIKDYSVKIIANTDKETDFDFTVDGEVYSYASVGDITKAFNISKHDTYFTISIDEDMSVKTMIEKLYDGSEITVPEEKIVKNYYLYTMVISSYNQSVTYEIDFACDAAVDGVTLDKEEIIF